MERNEKCFCGSGKKYKYCHIGIEKDSVLSNLISFYQILDKELEKSKNPAKCHTGCSACCHQVFAIQLSEFLYACYGYQRLHGNIENILNVGSSVYSRLVTEYPELSQAIQKIEFATDAASYQKSSGQLAECMGRIKIPCIFLNSSTNLCMVYDYRPIVCRYYGLAYLPISDDIDKFYIFKENVQGVTLSDLVNLDILGDNLIELSLFKSKKYNAVMFDMLFPIFYFCYLFTSGKDNFNFKFEKMKKLSRAKYADSMFERNLKK